RNGLGTLLEAMPRILERHPRARLTVVGDGPWRGYYERRARRLGAAVRFAGRVLGDRPEYYGGADLYLCPTTRSSFRVTLREAMGASGLGKAAEFAWPRVAARSPGVYERVIR